MICLTIERRTISRLGLEYGEIPELTRSGDWGRNSHEWHFYSFGEAVASLGGALLGSREE